MSFIPEWVSFQKEVRSAFTWQNQPSQTSWKPPFCPPSWKRYACATRPRLHGLRFHLGTEFVFSLHDTRMKCHTRTRISFGLKTGMSSFWNELCGNKISFRYHVNRYREIYGDGMNSFWNESHSGIMWTAPKSILPQGKEYERTDHKYRGEQSVLENYNYQWHMIIYILYCQVRHRSWEIIVVSFELRPVKISSPG